MIVKLIQVLELDADNVKALLRRAAARENMQDKKNLAYADLQAVLSIDPGNKEALVALDRLTPP